MEGMSLSLAQHSHVTLLMAFWSDVVGWPVLKGHVTAWVLVIRFTVWFCDVPGHFKVARRAREGLSSYCVFEGRGIIVGSVVWWTGLDYWVGADVAFSPFEALQILLLYP
jgi:hypothetical protein